MIEQEAEAEDRLSQRKAADSKEETDGVEPL
jgi:hypothetical protein